MPERYEHSGNAVGTSLTTAVGTGDTSLIIASAAGWPTGAVGKFWVVLDRGLATEEKVLALSRSGTTITVSARGADGSSAFAHSIGAAVEHNWSATEADDASAHIMASLAVHGLAGGVPVAGRTNAETLTNKTMSGSSNTFSAIPESAITNLVSDLAAKVDDSQIHASWLTALGLTLDADAATVLGAVGTGWPTILAAAPGSGWTAALAAALDADAATALGAMHTSWPAVLAAAIDADAATMLGAMGTGWPAYLAVAASVLRHQQVEEGTNITGIVSTTPAAGSPVCGMTFVAPPSGVVTIGVGGDIDQTQNTFVSILGWELRTGGTIGSGTIIQGANANYAFMLGGAVTTGGSPEGNATALRVITGLVAGDTYNVRTMHWVNGAGGTMNVYNRLLTVLPSP